MHVRLAFLRLYIGKKGGLQGSDINCWYSLKLPLGDGFKEHLYALFGAKIKNILTQCGLKNDIPGIVKASMLFSRYVILMCRKICATTISYPHVHLHVSE